MLVLEKYIIEKNSTICYIEILIIAVPYENIFKIRVQSDFHDIVFLFLLT